MSMTVNPSLVGGSSTATVDETPPGGAGTKTAPTDVDGATSQSGGSASTGRPTLVQPKMNAAAMMIALTALNSKIAQEGIEFGENVVQNAQSEIQKMGEKRAQQIKQHFDEMAKINTTEKCGLFGAIVKSFSKVFSGDIKGAGQVWADNVLNVLKDFGTIATAVIMVLGAIAVSGATLGAGSPLLVGAVIGASLMVVGVVASDPGLQSMVLSGMDEGEAKNKAATALSWVGFGVTVAGAILGIGCTLGMSSAASVGSISATVGTMGSMISGVNLATTLLTAKENYSQTVIRAKVLESGADMDRSEALMEEMKSILGRQQKDLQTLFDSYSNFIQSTRNLVMTQGQNEVRAASV